MRRFELELDPYPTASNLTEYPRNRAAPCASYLLSTVISLQHALRRHLLRRFLLSLAAATFDAHTLSICSMFRREDDVVKELLWYVTEPLKGSVTNNDSVSVALASRGSANIAPQFSNVAVRREKRFCRMYRRWRCSRRAARIT